jgi:hypothetical protein
MFYVYVLHSDADCGLYIGFSTDLRRRLKEHQVGEAFATSYRGPWRLIYYEVSVFAWLRRDKEESAGGNGHLTFGSWEPERQSFRLPFFLEAGS